LLKGKTKMPTNFNHPPSHEKEKADFKLVQFNDGELAFKYDADETKGAIPVGPESGFDYTEDFGPSGLNMAIIKTKTGNAYAVGAGVIINWKTKDAYIVPEDLPELELKASWQLPGGGRTSEVQTVLIRKGGQRAAVGTEGEQINIPSPFNDLIPDMERERSRLYPGANLPPLH
jgi:hypothetical protein